MENSVRNAFAATFLISVLPNIFLLFIPTRLLLQSSKDGEKLNFSALFLSFACGGLLGDVFIHILPHLLGAHDHGHEATHDHGHVTVTEHHHSSEDKDIELTNFLADVEEAHRDLAEIVSSEHHDEHKFIAVGVAVLIGFMLFFFFEKIINSSLRHHRHHHDKKDSSKDTNMQVSGWLNITADCMHNFTDGLAIGATFAAGGGLALATTISVFFHEIPHEIGDFSVLIKSGMSKWGAIRMQFITSTAAFIGTAIGLFARRHKLVEDYLLAVTAGGFVYIAAVNILPNISQSSDSFPQILLEVASFAVGVLFMVAVAFLE